MRCAVQADEKDEAEECPAMLLESGRRKRQSRSHHQAHHGPRETLGGQESASQRKTRSSRMLREQILRVLLERKQVLSMRRTKIGLVVDKRDFVFQSMWIIANVTSLNSARIC
jgi:hypothetical protein